MSRPASLGRAGRVGRFSLFTRLEKITPPAVSDRGRVSEALFLRVQALDVLCLGALRATSHIELDLFPLGEGLEALALDSGMMNEYVRAAVLLNETKALLVIEPLHFSLRHWYYSLRAPSTFSRSSPPGSPQQTSVPGSHTAPGLLNWHTAQWLTSRQEFSPRYTTQGPGQGQQQNVGLCNAPGRGTLD